MLRPAALIALFACAACTVDTSAREPDAGACPAGSDFFVSDVWPRYLVANQCGARGCHDFSDGHGYLRLRAPAEPAPVAGTPLDAWPLDWRENYLSTLQLVRCDQPLESRLLTVPEGESNLHPPGPVVRDRATAAAVVETWVAP